MNIDLAQRLYAKYPDIFTHRHHPETIIGQHGIECGEGWFELLDQLCGAITQYIDAHKSDEIESVVAVRITSHQQCLIFEYEGGNEVVAGMVRLAEQMSTKISSRPIMHHRIQQAADMVSQADALIIMAGAEMGVGSGLLDFQGENGFWHKTLPLVRASKSLMKIAVSELFEHNPSLAWMFYGWQLQQYRQVTPHQSFHLLKKWADQKSYGAFVVTNNVDGQFQKAGFSDGNIWEKHGSVHFAQCIKSDCESGIWSSENILLQINSEINEYENGLPQCPHCGSLARPNILMFADHHWREERERKQKQLFDQWLANCPKNVAVIEVGASRNSAVHQCSERISEDLNAPLIRIHPDDGTFDNHAKKIVLPMETLEALEWIEKAMKENTIRQSVECVF